MKKTNIPRREFLTKGVAGLAAVALTNPSKILAQTAGSMVSSEAIYDYIVIGSGAGGGPLAARLAQAGFKVLVLEAGPKDVNQNANIPALHLKSTEDPKYSWDFFVKHYKNVSEHGQKFVSREQGMFYPRASAIGGCTIHNAMIPIYPNNSDLNYLWHVTGDNQFSPNNMRWIYDNKVREWLSLEQADPTLALKDERLGRMVLAALREGLRREAGFSPTAILELAKTLTDFDPNSAENINSGEEGLFIMPKMTRDGKRHGPRNFLLETMARLPQNLFIKTDSLVSRIIFDENRSQGLKAIAVECFEKDHIYEACPQKNSFNILERFTTVKSYKAKREIIVAGGAFNSPQILMLSGIGDEAQLQAKGIRPLLNLKGVGKNLQDRYEMTVVNDLGGPSPLVKNCTFGASGDPCLADYYGNPQNSIYATNGLVAGLKVKSHKSLSEPDLMIFGGPVKFTGYFPGYSKEAVNRSDTFSWAILKGQTKNRAGEVSLKDKNPTTRPEINFNYFAENASDDMNGVVEGLKLTRKIVKRYRQYGLATLDLHAPEELFPGTRYQTDAELAQVTRKEAWGHHASCSNKMGLKSDPTTVVGGDFLVHGTQNLRVVDASVFPKIPGLFIAVPTFMMAEKAAIDIIRKARIS